MYFLKDKDYNNYPQTHRGSEQLPKWRLLFLKYLK